MTLGGDQIGYIPTLGVRYKDFFASASGMFATAYKFDVPSTFTQLHGGLTGFGASRQEADVNFGYYIHPMLGVSIGYKGIFQTLRIESPPAGGPTGSGCSIPIEPSQQKYNYNGPTVGLSTNVPLGEGGLGLLPWGLNLYGNSGGGYMNATASFKCAQLGNHAAYFVVEGGLAYKPSQLPLAFTVGYKYQLLNTQLNSGFKSHFGTNSVNDVTSGPLIGLIFVY